VALAIASGASQFNFTNCYGPYKEACDNARSNMCYISSGLTSPSFSIGTYGCFAQSCVNIRDINIFKRRIKRNLNLNSVDITCNQ